MEGVVVGVSGGVNGGALAGRWRGVGGALAVVYGGFAGWLGWWSGLVEA